MRSALSALLVGVLGASLAAAPASAQQPNHRGTDLFVTIAARECSSYDDIMANRSRNDLQESLRDLGRRSVYRAWSAHRPGCGGDQQSQLQTASRLALHARQGLQEAGGVRAVGVAVDRQKPLRHRDRDRSLASACATTRAGRPTTSWRARRRSKLTRGIRRDAPRSPNSLWIQGGTPSDPILNGTVSGTVRVRRAAVLGRQPVRQQRRVDRVPAGDRARLLLRVLRPAAADERDDRDPQGGARPAGGHSHLHLRRQPQLQRGRTSSICA